MSPNEFTSANAGGARLFRIPTPRAARIAEFNRSAPRYLRLVSKICGLFLAPEAGLTCEAGLFP
jgi:hypothetical protein